MKLLSDVRLLAWVSHFAGCEIPYNVLPRGDVFVKLWNSYIIFWYTVPLVIASEPAGGRQVVTISAFYK